jgi:histidyl-tRNA synthetase
MFRYERAQAGRYRQHHQFGVEAIGVKSPEQDVEVIDLIYTLYQRLGLQNLTLYINSLGDADCRSKFRDALIKYLERYKSDLSEDSLRRLDVNPLRILDSKDPKDIEIVSGAPLLLDFLNVESRQHFEQVQERLNLISIPFTINQKLVRGLDYYNQTVFEIVAGELGAQNSMSGGGRYDGLIKTLGGPDLPAFGFGCGLERVIQTMINQMVSLPKPSSPTLFFVPLGDKARERCFLLTHNLRRNGIAAQVDLSGRKLNKMMQYANQIRAQYVAVVGDGELESGVIELKEMESGETFSIAIEHVNRIMRIESEKDNLTKAWVELSTPFEDESQKNFFIKKMTSSLQSNSEISKDLESALENLQKIIE